MALFNIKNSLIIGLIALISISPPIRAMDNEIIHQSLARIDPNIKAESIKPTSLEGIMKVKINSNTMIYMNETGEYFFTGSMFANPINGQLANLTERDKMAERVALMATETTQSSWVFPAQGETKASITVFTDVDCFYCQKLHTEMAAINEFGIEVNYLAFPRAGLGSSSYQVLVDAWCAEDRNTFMTEAKRRSHNNMLPQVSPPACDNPVAAHYKLSQEMGLQGTPAIILENGTMWPGYLPADTLAQRLGVN